MLSSKIDFVAVRFSAMSEESEDADAGRDSQSPRGMPFEVLVAVVMLAAFGLAAYAIFAVVTVTKGRRK